MRCPNCQTSVPEGEKFCPQCGVPIEAAAEQLEKCPYCGAALLPGEHFCGECGQDVTQASTAPIFDSSGVASRKKSPWTWILIIVAVVAALGCLTTCGLLVIVPALRPTPTPLPTHTPTVTPTPLPTATFTPAPTPTPSVQTGTLLYEEDFTSPGDDWEIEESEKTSYTIDNGAYSIQVNKESWMAWNKMEPTVENFVLEFDVALVEGNKYNAYGVLFAYQDKNNRYELNINGNGSFSFGKDVQGEWSEIVDWTPSEAIKGTGMVNHIKLIGYQGDYMLYVNGQLIYEFTDTSLTDGQIAPMVTAYSNPPARATFDNIKLWTAEPRP